MIFSLICLSYDAFPQVQKFTTNNSHLITQHQRMSVFSHISQPNFGPVSFSSFLFFAQRYNYSALTSRWSYGDGYSQSGPSNFHSEQIPVNGHSFSISDKSQSRSKNAVSHIAPMMSNSFGTGESTLSGLDNFFIPKNPRHGERSIGLQNHI